MKIFNSDCKGCAERRAFIKQFWISYWWLKEPIVWKGWLIKTYLCWSICVDMLAIIILVWYFLK